MTDHDRLDATLVIHKQRILDLVDSFGPLITEINTCLAVGNHDGLARCAVTFDGATTVLHLAVQALIEAEARP